MEELTVAVPETGEDDAGLDKGEGPAPSELKWLPGALGARGALGPTLSSCEEGSLDVAAPPSPESALLASPTTWVARESARENSFPASSRKSPGISGGAPAAAKGDSDALDEAPLTSVRAGPMPPPVCHPPLSCDRGARARVAPAEGGGASGRPRPAGHGGVGGFACKSLVVF